MAELNYVFFNEDSDRSFAFSETEILDEGWVSVPAFDWKLFDIKRVVLNGSYTYTEVPKLSRPIEIPVQQPEEPHSAGWLHVISG